MDVFIYGSLNTPARPLSHKSMFRSQSYIASIYFFSENKKKKKIFLSFGSIFSSSENPLFF